MTVERDRARHLAEYDGVVYAFCSLMCRTRFIRDPAGFLARGPVGMGGEPAPARPSVGSTDGVPSADRPARRRAPA
jgi:YHS domain-containing protein